MRVFFTAILVLMVSQSFAQTQTFSLSNGLKILVKEDHRSPVAVTMVWYNVGSADEQGGITGVSHALEHLMFKGTKKFPLGVFSKKIAAIGGQENAFTSNDYTAYFEKIAAKDLETTFQLEADRMQGLQFNPVEFKKEMHVIQEERRLRTDDNPQALAMERFFATAQLASPYHHPVIGWMSDIKQLRIADARDWYRQYYAPNNATLVVVGDVRAQTVYSLAQKYFSRLTPRPQKTRKLQMEPRPLGKKTLHVEAPAQIPSLFVGFTVPSLKTALPNKEYTPYALELIAGILGAGDSSRMMQNLVKNQHIASQVEVEYRMYSRYQTQFLIFASQGQDKTLKDLAKAVTHELEQLIQHPVGEQELERIKTQIIAEKTFEKDSIFSQAMELGLLETLGLGLKASSEYVAKINAITPAQIQETAARYFNEKNRTDAKLIPVNPPHQSGVKP